jgi:hypothetical protein
VWIITAWQHISPVVIVKDVRKCCISRSVDGTDDDICGMIVKRMGMLGVSVRKMKALTVKTETDW